jgi:serine/threonine protein kinase
MSTERTIRPANLDGTLRTTNQDGTIRPPHSDGTVRPANPDGTVRVTSAVSTSLGMDGTVRADKQAIQQDNVNDDSFLLKGVKYRNIQCLSDNSGEAQVFLVEKDGEEYVLKIYYPNFDVNKSILQAVLNFDFEMIVRVYDYGKTYVEGKHRYYELMEYLRGGSMADYKLG